MLVQYISFSWVSSNCPSSQSLIIGILFNEITRICLSEDGSFYLYSIGICLARKKEQLVLELKNVIFLAEKRVRANMSKDIFRI